MRAASAGELNLSQSWTWSQFITGPTHRNKQPSALTPTGDLHAAAKCELHQLGAEEGKWVEFHLLIDILKAYCHQVKMSECKFAKENCFFEARHQISPDKLKA